MPESKKIDSARNRLKSAFEKLEDAIESRASDLQDDNQADDLRKKLAEEAQKSQQLELQVQSLMPANGHLKEEREILEKQLGSYKQQIDLLAKVNKNARAEIDELIVKIEGYL